MDKLNTGSSTIAHSAAMFESESEPLPTHPVITASAAATILVLAVDTSFATHLGYTLREAGYSVRLATQSPPDLPQALRGVHLVLVPVFGSHFETESYCQQIKGSTPSPPIIAVGPDDLSFKLRLFAVGVDDYVLDSCHALEFLARVKSLIRRRRAADGRHRQSSVE